MENKTFKREEKKYLLTESQYNELFDKIESHLVKDDFHESTISNIYFDNMNNDLITTSMEKPLYKEKVRVRSYSTPTLEDNVFLEIKKKYKGIVYKRRIKLLLNDFYKFLKGEKIENKSPQILKEIEFCFQKYNLIPSLFLAYDRKCYKSKEDPGLRITFDENIRFRTDNLKLEDGDYGNQLFENKYYLMEVKANLKLPIWFAGALSSLKIYPKSFSKYGNIYTKQELTKKGVNYYGTNIFN